MRQNLKILLLATSISLSLATNQLAAKEIKASVERMETRIKALSVFGGNSDGGVDLVAYSNADLAAREYMIELMKDAGLSVRIDTAGNIIGRRAGHQPMLAPIMFGSHLDSVPGGGNYDGQVGSVGAIEVMDMLKTANIITDHPLEMIIFQNEEGGTVGSMAIVGVLKQSALADKSSSGFTIGEGIDRLGGDQSKIKEAEYKKPLHAFVELHIEQGGFLEADNLDIGIVEGIVGINWWTITVEGMANHGGTTPMPGRRDSLVAASKMVVAINELATNMKGRQVATVGKIQAFPGAPNVIPGRVEMSLEVRDLDAAKIDHGYEIIVNTANNIATDMNVKVSFAASNVNARPAPTDTRIRAIVEEASKELSLSYKYMPSGAGHDAQEMATITPTGMIFVPSKNGISHAPAEYTSPRAMANGADVLFKTILKLDKTKFD